MTSYYLTLLIVGTLAAVYVYLRYRNKPAKQN